MPWLIKITGTIMVPVLALIIYNHIFKPLLSVPETINELSNSVENLSNKIDHNKEIFNSIIKINRDNISRLERRVNSFSPIKKISSPITLSDRGIKISNEIDAKSIAIDVVEMLEFEIQGMTLYDIQEYCHNYMTKEFVPTNEMQIKLKEVAYNNGVKVYDVLDVISIELRDVLISRKTQ